MNKKSAKKRFLIMDVQNHKLYEKSVVLKCVRDWWEHVCMCKSHSERRMQHRNKKKSEK